MKKLYLLSLLLCLGISVFGQTVNVYSTWDAGSFKSGSSTSTTRTDGDIIISSASRGYSVFDLSSIPPNATITACSINYYLDAVTPGAPGAYATYGYAGDLSTITNPAALYPAMSSGTLLSSNNYGFAAGNQAITSNLTIVSYIQSHFASGTPISICWTSTGGSTFTITGETGLETTSPPHAPYLLVSYTCAGLSGSAPTSVPFICPHSSFALSAGSVTGATSYLWTGPGGFTSTAANPTVAVGPAVTSVYTLTAYNAAGCSYNSATFVPVQYPPYTDIYVLNYSAFCTGDFSHLSGVVPFSTTYTYQWYNNGAEITGATDAEYNATAGGDYKVLVTDASTGCADSAATPTHVVLLDSEAPTSPMGTLHLCPGNSAVITIDPAYLTPDITLQWQKDDVDIAGAISSSYNASVAGVYKCILTTPVSTCYDSTTKDTVITNGSPVPVVSIAGGMLTTSNTYSAYQWYLNTVAISGATNSSIVPASNGSYRVRVSDGSACAGYSASFPYYTTGVGQLNKSGISIYPNPVNTVLHIESPLAVKAIITGLEGRVQLVQADAKDMDISVLANGMYIISLYDAAGERVAVQEFVKQ